MVEGARPRKPMEPISSVGCWPDVRAVFDRLVISNCAGSVASRSGPASVVDMSMVLSEYVLTGIGVPIHISRSGVLPSCSQVPPVLRAAGSFESGSA